MHTLLLSIKRLRRQGWLGRPNALLPQGPCWRHLGRRTAHTLLRTLGKKLRGEAANTRGEGGGEGGSARGGRVGEEVGERDDRGRVGRESEGAEVGVGGRMVWWGWRRRVGEVTKGGVVHGGESTLVEGRESFLQGGRDGGTRTGRRTNGGTERSEGAQSDVVGGHGGGMPCGSSGRWWRRSGCRSGPGVLGEGVGSESSGGIDGVRRRGETRTTGWASGGTR